MLIGSQLLLAYYFFFAVFQQSPSLFSCLGRRHRWFSLVDVKWRCRAGTRARTRHRLLHRNDVLPLAPHRRRAVFLRSRILAAVDDVILDHCEDCVASRSSLSVVDSRPWKRRSSSGRRLGAQLQLRRRRSFYLASTPPTWNVLKHLVPLRELHLSPSSAIQRVHDTARRRCLCLSLLFVRLAMIGFVGLVICVVAGFVVVQSIRDSQSLAAVLIIFGLLFHLLITTRIDAEKVYLLPCLLASQYPKISYCSSTSSPMPVITCRLFNFHVSVQGSRFYTFHSVSSLHSSSCERQSDAWAARKGTLASSSISTGYQYARQEYNLAVDMSHHVLRPVTIFYIGICARRSRMNTLDSVPAWHQTAVQIDRRPGKRSSRLHKATMRGASTNVRLADRDQEVLRGGVLCGILHRIDLDLLVSTTTMKVDDFAVVLEHARIAPSVLVELDPLEGFSRSP